MRSSWLGLALGGLAACGGDPAGPATSAEGGADTTSSTTAATTTGAGGSARATWKASVVAETEPGRAPAHVAFTNDTAGTLVSGIIGFTQFWIVEPGMEVPAKLAISDDVQGDARIGTHANNDPGQPCSFLDVTVGGVGALQPGQGYSFRVFDDGDTIGGEIGDHTTPAPFLAVRGKLASPLPPGSTLTVELADQQPLVVELLQNDATTYRRVDASEATITHLALDSSQGRWEAPATVELSGAVGFTVHVGYQVPEGIDSVELSESP